MTRCGVAFALILGTAAPVAACPFCTAVKPSLSQHSDEAVIAALAGVSRVGAAEIQFDLHKVLAGAALLAEPRQLVITASDLSGAAMAREGQLALLLASRTEPEKKRQWEFIPLDEASYAYVARAPSRRVPAARRLGYFAKYLEHANRLMAEDAYLEFGSASYDEVRQVASELPFASLRLWMVDPNIPEERKGFYGLALGLATNDADARANEKLLRQLIDAPADDFRAGFDGILGGYLVLAGSEGLKRLDERLLSNPQARTGDLRHAATALRFIREFGRGSIPAPDLNRAMRQLLARPETAAGAIVDLARWEDWDSLDAVVSLFDRQNFCDGATTRAIVGYLRACPRAAASEALARLRKQDPRRVALAEQGELFSPSRQ
jgi:hypothetical protein